MIKSKLRKKIERVMDFYCDRVGGGLGSLAAFGVAKFRAKSEREN